MKDKGIIFNIQHFSLDDGPGIRTVVFLKGCPLDCIWCHNPESKSHKIQLMFDASRCVMCRKCESVCQSNCHLFDNSEHMINRKNCTLCNQCVNICDYDALTLCGREYTSDEVMTEIEKDDMFFGDEGGVTFSGGEPFYQSDFLLSLLKKCKQKGYHTCVETSGYTSNEIIRECAPYIDLFLFDNKETDEKLHKKYTRYDNHIIYGNLTTLDKMKKEVILRCPVIPECNMREEHFRNIAIVANKYNCIKSIEILPYHPLGISKCKKLDIQPGYKNEKFLQKEILKEFVQIIKVNTTKPVLIK